MTRTPRTAACACLCLALLPLAGCQSDVVVSPPEEQATVYHAEPLGSFVHMNQPDAVRYFVSGIQGLEANTWRWAGREAVLRFQLQDTSNLQFVVRFAVPREVIARNGPVRLTTSFNGKIWKGFGYAKDGIYEIAEPAPARLLKPSAENRVSIAIDKPLPPDHGGPEQGFILVYAGFRAGQGRQL
ncbi:MAG TPA: hypothetical protein VEU62_21055 [Bryobacterales bacterium]|nr:hypothetical protein [Bryobacterales bacterium]